MDNLMEAAVKEKRDVVRPKRQTNCRSSSPSPLLQIQCPSLKPRSAANHLLRPPSLSVAISSGSGRSAPLTFLPTHPVTLSPTPADIL